MAIPAGRVFVGRERERAALARALDDAAAGSPRLVLIGGEPGIGKTSLGRELRLEAGRRGMRVLSGQCYEHGSLKLPYLPFVEAIELYAREGWPHEWAPTALLARIVPGLRARGIEPPDFDAGGSPYPLFEAVADFLRLAAAEQPIVLLLEDLHDADEGTLDLLAHLGRRLARARVLIAGTYRDSEVDPSHPLSAALAALQRSEIFERMRLRGLSQQEVRELYERTTGRSPAAGVGEALHAHTEGNPLFASETLRHLESEGLLDAGSEAILRAVPDGLREVIGRRLLKLSEPSRGVLAIAAVVGRDFRLDILERLCGHTASDVPKALHEAQAARVIEEQPGAGAALRYRFGHTLFRQYLYEGVPATRRNALHVEAAAAIESIYGSALEDMADALSEHLMHSSDAGDLDRASHLSETASRRALSVYAYGEAARLARRSLEALTLATPADRARRCELLLLLGDALNHTGQPRIAIDEALEEAFALAEGAGDRKQVLRACLLAREGLQLKNQGGTVFSEGALWADRLDRHALPATRERIYADDYLIAHKVLAGTFAAGDRGFERLRDQAWEIGDPETCWLAGGSHLMFQRQPEWDESRLATLKAMLKLPRDGVPTHVLQQGLNFLCTALLEFGDRTHAEQVKDELLALARRTGDLSTRVWANRLAYWLAVVDGRFEYGLQLLAETDAEVIASGIFTDPFNRPEAWGFRAMLLLGRNAVTVARAPLPPSSTSNAASGGDAPGQRAAQLRQVFAGQIHWRAGSVLQHALAERDTDSVFVWVDYFKGTRQVTNSLVLINRLLGEAQVLLGHSDEARASLVLGLEQAQAMRFRPEIALTRVSLATLLLDHYPAEEAEARRQLELALSELREMGMRPGLERAEALWARIDQAARPERSARPRGLTTREIQVLRLIAAGRTNREISAELVLSERTVGRHITNIYAKIDARGKADATAFALRHNLT